MSTKSKPSLYKGDYYTIEEYEALAGLLGGNLLSKIIKANIRKGAVTIKRRLHGYHDVFRMAVPYDLIYNIPLNDVPLYLSRDDVSTTICQWRFQINK